MGNIDNSALVGALGIMLTVNGFLLKYVFTAHTKKIDDLQRNCIKRAEEVQGNVDKNGEAIEKLEAKVDQKVAVLDRDIKNVGEKLGEQIRVLTSDLFNKIEQSRIEQQSAMRDINSRLDRALTRSGQ